MAGHPEEADLQQDLYTDPELEDSELSTGSASLGPCVNSLDADCDEFVSSSPREFLAGSDLIPHPGADEYGDGDLPNPSLHSSPEALSEEEDVIPYAKEDEPKDKPEDLGHE